MERFQHFLGIIFQVIFSFIKNFTRDLFNAIYFKALEYDSILQQTKTQGQRIAIWSVIGVVTLGIILLLLNLLFRFFSNLQVVSGV